MVISLRRGTDWVSTGLYNPADKKADGSARYSATDFVVKYTLQNVNGGTAVYKNPVRLADGTTNTYCVQHDDGTIYVLDSYDPYSKCYKFFVPDSPTQTTDYQQPYSVMQIWKSKANGMDIQLFAYPYLLTHYCQPEFLIKPIGYTTTGAGETRMDYYPASGTGVPTQFTYWYFDNTNGIPIQYGGQPFLTYSTLNDPSTLWPNTRILETHGYHNLFFSGEKASFINTPIGCSQMATYGNLTTSSAILQSCTTLARVAPTQSLNSMGWSWSDRAVWNAQRSSATAYRNYLVPASDGAYKDSSGNRYDCLVWYPSNFPNMLLNNFATTDPTPPTYSTALTKITVPSITIPGTAISFITPTVTLSATATLNKGVDYVMTGIYPNGQFTNSIVVKANINGTVAKYPVYLANGTLNEFFIVYTDPVTQKTTNYVLNNFDPYERYYTIWQSGVLDNAPNPFNETSILNNRTALPYGRFRNKIAPTGYSLITGPTYYGVGGGYGVDPVTSPKFTYTYNGNTAEFSLFTFDGSVTTGVPIQHAGESFLLDPYALATGTISPKNLYYHEFMFNNELCTFLNYSNNIFGNSTTKTLNNGTGLGSPTVYYMNSTTYNPVPNINIATNNAIGGSGGRTTALLECSLNLERAFATQNIGTFLRCDFGFGMPVLISYQRCVVRSFCGLYTDASGNRYDYLTFSNNSGYYTPVESLTNQLPISQITSDTGGLLTGRIFSLMPSVDILSPTLTQVSNLQAQLASQAAADQAAQAAAVAAQAAADQVAQAAAVAAQAAADQAAQATALAAQHTADQALQAAAVAAQLAADQAAQAAAVAEQLAIDQAAQAAAVAAQIAADQIAQAAAVAEQLAADQAAQAAAVAAQAAADQVAQAAAVAAQLAADQAEQAAALAAQHTTDQALQAAAVAAQLAADQAAQAAIQAHLSADEAALAVANQQISGLNDPNSVNLNLFGYSVTITKTQVISTTLFAACGAGIAAVIAFSGIIFV